MNRHVTFWSSRFESGTPRPHFINENCFGEDVAGWLRGELAGAGFQPDELIQEDYGWGFWTQMSGDPYWIFAGVMEDSAGREEAEWLVGITYDPGLSIARRLFRRPRGEDLLRLCRAVDAVLQAAAGVRGIRWWHEPHAGEPAAHPE